MHLFVLARKAYARNLQYRGSHTLNTVASAIFGFIAVAIWKAVGQDHSLGQYGVQGMVEYVAFNQACLWIAGFLTQGLGIPATVRTGQIALDLIRPISLFPMLMIREWGQVLYQAVYKTLPIYLFYILVFGLRVPVKPSVWIWTLIALTAAAYMAICQQYLIGIAALWTTETNWLVWLNFAVFMLLSGYLVPLEWLPEWMQRLSIWTFYPYLQYIPTRLYLGMETGGALLGSAVWCALLTLMCMLATRFARRKLEVQGG